MLMAVCLDAARNPLEVFRLPRREEEMRGFTVKNDLELKL